MESQYPESEYVSFGTNTGIQYRRILTGADAKETFNEIPVIDVSTINSPDLEVRKKLAEQINDAATNVGFFYVENPPIDTRLMDGAFEASKKFFDLPVAEKEKVHVDRSYGGKGWQAGKNMAVNETFRMGNDYTEPEQHYIKVAEPGTPSMNHWPDEALPEFRQAFYAYYKEVRAFCNKLVGVFALALGLEESGLDHLFKYPLTDFTIQHYFKHQNAKGSPTLGAHTDFGAFTCLLQHEVGGLEVLNANAIWVPAPVREHAFIINTGTYFEALSNGRWMSTVHRVCSLGDQDRYTIPFFYGFDPSVTVRPLELTPGEKPKYDPVCIGITQLQGLTFSLPEHPLSKRLNDADFVASGYTYDMLLGGRQVEDHVATYQQAEVV